ncbi:MAG: spore germination protein GerW family protein [Candidatus Limnocylindria bacterium]
MDVQVMLSEARDAMTVRRVYGDPYEKDGITVIPAAKVRGGGGGGGDKEGNRGGGFGLSATPTGAYVVRNGDVRWRPAVDVNRAILGGQLVAIVALLALRSIVKALAKRR